MIELTLSTDTGFEIRALAVWGRARYLSVMEAPHNTDFHPWMGKKHFCFFQTAETGNRTPNSGVKGSGANHYPRAPARGMTKHVNRGEYAGATMSLNRDKSLHLVIISRYPSEHETLIQCWVNDGPPSAKLAQHWPNNESMSRVYWDGYTIAALGEWLLFAGYQQIKTLPWK